MKAVCGCVYTKENFSAAYFVVFKEVSKVLDRINPLS